MVWQRDNRPCRPGPCKVHGFSPLATICYHCNKPQEGMNFECDDCTKRKVALEEIANAVTELCARGVESKKDFDYLIGPMLEEKLSNLNTLTPTKEKD